jgi:hypothetical protein
MTNEFRDRPTIPLQMAEQPTGKSTPGKRTEAVMAMRLLTERQVSTITAIPHGNVAAVAQRGRRPSVYQDGNRTQGPREV